MQPEPQRDRTNPGADDTSARHASPPREAQRPRPANDDDDEHDIGIPSGYLERSSETRRSPIPRNRP